MTIAVDTARRVNPTALVLAAAAHHPDAALRAALEPLVHKWLHDVRPLHSAERIQSLLDAERGTVLEPFSLDSAQRTFVTWSLMAAFSEQADADAVCVVGREVVGTTGGLVVRRDLQARYRSGREHGRLEDGESYIAPLALPKPGASKPKSFGPASATMLCTPQGIEVRVRCAQLNGRARELAPVFADNSYIVGARKGFNGLGLRVQGMGNELQISTGSPESVIRFATLAAARPALVLQARTKGCFRPALVVRLEDPSADPVPLRAAYVAAVDADLPWTSLDYPDFPLEAELRYQIACWYHTPTPWLDDLIPHIVGDAA